MTPYAKTTVTEAEHAWYVEISHHAATVAALALAKGTMRLGQAHRYMLAAHLSALMDGMGEAEALACLDEMVEDLRHIEGLQTPAVVGR